MKAGFLVTAWFALAVSSQTARAADYAEINRIFEDQFLDSHSPGLAYGIVVQGRLDHVGAFGIQDVENRRPVTAETLFRIASMTKAFTALTILKLRDDGKLRLDALAEDYVPEMRGWTYPTRDSPRIEVRDLLSHVGGFVTDNPWGDRQTPMPEAEFTAFLKAGVPFTRTPQNAYEYSNLGFAILGRIITNVSKHPYEQTIGRVILSPLGMSATGFDAEAAPIEKRALGYRWEDGAWKSEPVLGPGAFGAMGGIQTSAVDYAKWVAFLLSAWPPRDDADPGPVKRASIRELSEGLNFASTRPRPGAAPNDNCRDAVAYGKGMGVTTDCDFGLVLGHGGGYPGFGSYVLLLPQRGVGLFAFSNRTYGGPTIALWKAALAMEKSGLMPKAAPIEVTTELARGYRAAGDIYKSGGVETARDLLAMNFLLDRDAAAWGREITKLKSEVGACVTDSAVVPTGRMTGEFTWRCEHGRLRGVIELAPTLVVGIQTLGLSILR